MIRTCLRTDGAGCLRGGMCSRGFGMAGLVYLNRAMTATVGSYYLKKILQERFIMKKSMSREHADHLKRCYMSMGLDHEIMVGLHSQRAQAYDLLANIHTQVTSQGTPANDCCKLHHCGCANS